MSLRSRIDRGININSIFSSFSTPITFTAGQAHTCVRDIRKDFRFITNGTRRINVRILVRSSNILLRRNLRRLGLVTRAYHLLGFGLDTNLFRITNRLYSVKPSGPSNRSTSRLFTRPSVFIHFGLVRTKDQTFTSENRRTKPTNRLDFVGCVHNTNACQGNTRRPVRTIPRLPRLNM